MAHRSTRTRKAPKTRQRGSQGRIGRILRRLFLGHPEDIEEDSRHLGYLEPYDVNIPQMIYPEQTPLRNELPRADDPVLEAEGYLREYIHPIIGDRPFDPESDDTQDFPVVCANGCPEGYRGQHKFSCDLAGQTQLKDCQPSSDPERPTTQFRKVP